jgi:hypothetical protein
MLYILSQLLLINKPLTAATRGILIIDVSGSLSRVDEEGIARAEATEALCFVVEGSQLGMVWFAETSTLNQPLTVVTKDNRTIFSQLMRQSALPQGGYTEIGIGLQQALKVLQQAKQPEDQLWVLLVSDGELNADEKRGEDSNLKAFHQLFNEIVPVYKEEGIPIHTIGLLQQDEQTFGKKLLMMLSQQTDGQFYEAHVGSDFVAIFQLMFPRIAQKPAAVYNLPESGQFLVTELDERVVVIGPKGMSIHGTEGQIYTSEKQEPDVEWLLTSTKDFAAFRHPKPGVYSVFTQEGNPALSSEIYVWSNVQAVLSQPLKKIYSHQEVIPLKVELKYTSVAEVARLQEQRSKAKQKAWENLLEGMICRYYVLQAGTSEDVAPTTEQIVIADELQKAKSGFLGFLRTPQKGGQYQLGLELRHRQLRLPWRSIQPIAFVVTEKTLFTVKLEKVESKQTSDTFQTTDKICFTLIRQECPPLVGTPKTTVELRSGKTKQGNYTLTAEIKDRYISPPITLKQQGQLAWELSAQGEYVVDAPKEKFGILSEPFIFYESGSVEVLKAPMSQWKKLILLLILVVAVIIIMAITASIILQQLDKHAPLSGWIEADDGNYFTLTSHPKRTIRERFFPRRRNTIGSRGCDFLLPNANGAAAAIGVSPRGDVYVKRLRGTVTVNEESLQKEARKICNRGDMPTDVSLHIGDDDCIYHYIPT